MTQNKDKKQRILIAEDDNFYASIYNQRLVEMGYDVEVVGDGEKLIEAINTKVPDLIMLDLIMPKLDGFETLRLIKSNPKFKNVKVLILSNLGQKEDVDLVMQLGASGYIIKNNVSIQDVLTRVRESLA